MKLLALRIWADVDAVERAMMRSRSAASTSAQIRRARSFKPTSPRR